MGITAAQKMRLGVFVVIGMITLAAFIVVPIGMKMSNRTKTYYSFFEGETLQGLEQGASVKFNGVNIGKVQKVSYYPENINRMKVEMSIADQFPMRVDMFATTGLIGITGLKYVEISGGSNEAAILKPGGEIPTRKTLFGTIGDKVETFIAKLEILLDNIAMVTDPDSLHSVKIAIDNLADLTGGAKGLFADVRGLIPTAESVIDSVQSTVNEIVKITQNVNDITTIFREGVEGGNIPELIAQVDTTIMSVKTLTDNLTLTVLQTREDFSVTMENLRETAESANQLVRMLAENPSLLIRGDGKERDKR